MKYGKISENLTVPNVCVDKGSHDTFKDVPRKKMENMSTKKSCTLQVDETFFE